ncbi:hypothetical protein [Flavobacterium johnsoniae]|uniref:Hypothetical lipoprotein n=1 Tax=Flavobacterium johnsoniae (strain ATCC 17061 / DSM 2064 / JCM 8514 / BCRC 14874 / CCUG 350202 / NBRC 14942 / NCIMB 11054 / UW101) TaxID=376686 RepID=A5FDK5_FLAJ1|nr:hypothetical protein [Flavobacterium johnsoniae]ABQ06719.1 hypothetical lipoprotein [Flavobacterium johnsoniae UW101]OXE95253.1 hypothetical protein B0A63_25095 [Flavobacterium johnsoniae UW101]WQG82477.1 hypothetical protein SR927_05025 [Flavobacterium johnsoniae UW101]
MKIKQTLRIINVVIVFFTLTSCFEDNATDSTFENLIKSTSVDIQKTYEIKLDKNIKFDYDKLFIFEGPRFPSEIEGVTKIKYDDVLDDGDRLYLYVKGNIITKKEKSTSKDVNIHRLMNEQGYTVLYPNTVIFAKKQKNGDDFYYDTFINN